MNRKANFTTKAQRTRRFGTEVLLNSIIAPTVLFRLRGVRGYLLDHIKSLSSNLRDLRVFVVNSDLSELCVSVLK
jgi:hypothetical protein